MELCNYPNTEKIRFYEVEAIEIPIVYNKYGDHDPNGLLYVLKKDADRIKEGALRNFALNPPQPFEEVMPLVIRANVGDKVMVTFTHSLKRPLSIHVQGLDYDVQTSDGADVKSIAQNPAAGIAKNFAKKPVKIPICLPVIM